jgi:hypothetical protein
MVRRVALVRTDVSEESIASIIRVTRIGELGTLAVISNPRKQEPHGVNIVEDAILQIFSFLASKEEETLCMQGMRTKDHSSDSTLRAVTFHRPSMSSSALWHSPGWKDRERTSYKTCKI